MRMFVLAIALNLMAISLIDLKEGEVTADKIKLLLAGEIFVSYLYITIFDI